MKIIKIDGIRGLITALFVGVCLVAGFVVFPGLVAMNLWNKYCVVLLEFPQIGLIQGVLLWGIVLVSYCILTKNDFAISFKNSTNELSDPELNMIMKNAQIYSKMKKINSKISEKDKFVKSEPFDKDLSVTSETKINDENDKTISN